jgi:predicted dehydrogenase
MAEKVTLAIVGCGGIAGAHREGLRKLWEAGIRDFEVIATVDIDRARAEKMADQVAEFQGKRPTPYQQLEEMLQIEKSLQAVDICSVHRNHHTLAIPCFEAGKHVTIEKPLALTLKAGRQMLGRGREGTHGLSGGGELPARAGTSRHPLGSAAGRHRRDTHGLLAGCGRTAVVLDMA